MQPWTSQVHFHVQLSLFFSSDCLRKFCESDNFRAEVFSMQRNIISLTVCTNLIEDSFAGASSFYTFETSSFSRSCTPFLFSSSLIFLIVVRGRSISSVALNFSTSFPGFSIFLAWAPALTSGTKFWILCSSNYLRKFCESDNFREEVFSMQRNIVSFRHQCYRRLFSLCTEAVRSPPYLSSQLLWNHNIL